MCDLITEKDIKQGEYLDILKRTKSKLFSGYNLEQILFNETYYCFSFDEKEVKKQVLKGLISRPSLIDAKVRGKEILTFYTKPYRNDYEEYWQKILDDVGEHDEITMLTKFDNKLRKLEFTSFFKKLNWYRILKKELKEIRNEKDRKYLSIQLVARRYTLNKIDKMNLFPKVVMCFFDSSPDESVVMQYFKKRGAVTVTNQHGQAVFRSWDYERVNQSQILNFKCDFYFAKGDMQKRQMEMAGVDGNKIKLVGIIGEHKQEIKNNKTKVFGVYLDWSGFSFADKSNLILIKMAKVLAQKIGFKYFIKVHPGETLEKYKTIVDENCIAVYGEKLKLTDTFDKAEFVIIHVSSTYVDAYFYGIRCFKFDTDIAYPIAFGGDCFSTIDEIIEKLAKWNMLSDKERKNYILKVRKMYDVGWKAGIIRKNIEEIMKAC